MFLRNYFLDSSKNPGSFVSHIRYCLIFKFLISATVSGSRRCLADSLFILPQLFPFVKRFLKISFRKFWKRTALQHFREGFKILWTSVFTGVVPPRSGFRSRGDLTILPQAAAFVNRKIANQQFICFMRKRWDKTSFSARYTDCPAKKVSNRLQ